MLRRWAASELRGSPLAAGTRFASVCRGHRRHRTLPTTGGVSRYDLSDPLQLHRRRRKIPACPPPYLGKPPRIAVELMLAHHDVEKLAPALREFDVTVSIQQLRETRLTGVAPLGTEEHEKQWRDSMHENFGNWLRARRAYLSFIPYMGEATERQQAIMCDKKLTPKQIAAELKANGMTASVEQIVEAHTSGEVADAPYDGFLVWFLRCCKLVDYQSLIEQDDVAKFEKVVSNSDEEVTPAAVKRIASNANAKTV